MVGFRIYKQVRTLLDRTPLNRQSFNRVVLDTEPFIQSLLYRALYISERDENLGAFELGFPITPLRSQKDLLRRMSMYVK